MKILLLSVLLFATTLFANIGKISALSGEVNISRDSKKIPATIGFELQEKDKIATSSNARAQLLFNDKTVISLGKNSTFDIEEYFYDIQKPTQTKASFKVAKGIFKTITGQIGKVNPNKFTLKTRSASIGIRGTIFFGDIPEAPTQPEILSCSDGIIEVVTPAGIQQVGANQFTTVKPNQSPTPPQDLPPEQKEEAEQNSGASENEKESGYDDGVFYESKIPKEEIPKIEPRKFVPTIPDLIDQGGKTKEDGEDIIDEEISSDKLNTLNQTSNSIHYKDLSTNYAIPTGDVTFSFDYITNATITSTLGTGIIMKVADADNDFSWGFWSSTEIVNSEYVAEKVWVLSEKNIVSDLSSLTSANNATYSGKVMGYDNYNSSFIDPSNSTITLDFDFGANTAVVNMVINADSQSISSINNMTGTYSYDGSKYTITGSNNEVINASFYDNMNSTGGTVTTDNVSAVFTAQIQ